MLEYIVVIALLLVVLSAIDDHCHAKRMEKAEKESLARIMERGPPKRVERAPWNR